MMFLQLALNLGLGSGGSSRQPALCLALLVLCFALLRCCFAAPCFALLCLGGSHCDNLGSRETVHKPGFPHLDPAHNEHNQAWANKSCRGCFNTHTHPTHCWLKARQKRIRNAGFNQSLTTKRMQHMQSSLRHRKAAPAAQAIPHALPALECESSCAYTNLLMCVAFLCSLCVNARLH